jgi:preprotein translocase subunit SecD
MYKRAGRRLFWILLLTLVALFISLPNEIPIKFSFGGLSVNKTLNRPPLSIKFGSINIERNFDLKLGLDLVGGSRLVFEADASAFSADKKSDALQSLREVVERRVNLFGVSEPNIQLSTFQGKDRILVELPGIKDTQKAIELVGKTAQLMFAEVKGEAEKPQIEFTDLTGADLKSAQVSLDRVKGSPVVMIEFTDEGGRKFADLTEKNVGRELVMFLDGQVISAPRVQEKIEGGSAIISGNFTMESAKELSIQLNAGALPVPIKLVEERTVGATLGAESIQKSVKAGLVGIGIVGAFMIVMYGGLGLIADVGLIIFGVLTLALYKLIPVVLTLPGIAGFLLSVGMAVDSNILVFERFNEEKMKGINTIYALETSFGRAWDSIRDANIATLVTAFILANPLNWPFLHTSGPVRGFAITLALGIGISLFTGIVVSRNLLRFFIKDTKNK